MLWHAASVVSAAAASVVSGAAVVAGSVASGGASVVSAGTAGRVAGPLHPSPSSHPSSGFSFWFFKSLREGVSFFDPRERPMKGS